MRKLLLSLTLLSAALLLPPSSHAQFIVVGQGCGASGLSAIANDGTPVVCKGSPLVWTAIGGSGGVPGQLNALTFNAKTDWRQAATDGTCANSSTAISWGTANEITSADVGKVIDISSPGGGNTWQNSTRTTIASVNSTTTGTLSAVTAAGGCGTPVTFFVYTDNASAFNAADLAASNAGAGTIVYYPCGDYGVASTIWAGQTNQIAHVGGNAGRAQSAITNNCTRIHISPAIWTAGLNALVTTDTYEANISFTGNSMVIPSAKSNAGLIQWSAGSIVQNMQFTGFNGSNGANQSICTELGDNFAGYSISCQGDSSGFMLSFSGHSLSMMLVDPQFFNMDISDLGNGSIHGGNIGKLTTAGGGGGAVYPFIGTAFSNTITLTKPSTHTVDITFDNVQMNCGNTSNFAMVNIGANSTGRFVGFKQFGSADPQSCPGTPTIVNNGTLISGGGNQFNNVGWSGSGSYFLSCTDFQTAPTISSGFGTSPSISAGASPCSFQVNVGTGGTATSGVIGLPTAPHGWTCFALNQTTNVAVRESAFTTASCTLAVTTAWSASDIVSVQAAPF